MPRYRKTDYENVAAAIHAARLETNKQNLTGSELIAVDDAEINLVVALSAMFRRDSETFRFVQFAESCFREESK